MEPSLYHPIPDDWVIGITDVVDSTTAISSGRYKVVNTAGAAAIAAVSNGLEGVPFPFVFGGDGAGFAVAPDQAEVARSALSATATWVREELDLSLRAALVPLREIRAAGWDVRVARFAPSPNITYAMFAGGGMAWAEREMKLGRFALPAAPPGSRPDLTGLSCRWAEIPAQRGLIMSLIIMPAGPATIAEFRALVEEVLQLATGTEAERPISQKTLTVGWPPKGFSVETRIRRPSGWVRASHALKLGAETLVAYLILRLNLRVGGFDAARYKRQLVENSDFRKYDDGLRMTLDCTPALAEAIESRLEAAARANVARYGLHRQQNALMTCIVPAPKRSDHVHFIDGASGGYAAAARALKGALGAAPA
jgi:hypothetical protein